MVEMSMVSGVGQASAYAIVVLAENLRPRQREAGVRAQVEAELAQLLQKVNAQVADYEQLRMIVVADEAWSIENGMLTPTMKIRRARIEKAVGGQVERWFGARGAVIWA
jgi:long-subunit acyl-CoA synthetase (AMP-forming)